MNNFILQRLGKIIFIKYYKNNRCVNYIYNILRFNNIVLFITILLLYVVQIIER